MVFAIDLFCLGFGAFRTHVTPYPFCSTCKSGECTPFNLNESEIEVETEAPAAQSPVLNSETTKASNIQRNEIYDSPGRLVRPLLQPDLPGYQRQIQGEDPVLFMSHKGNMYNSQGVHKSEDVSAVKFRNGRLQSATWHLQLNACPVPCGGGWTSVEHQCEQLGELVREEHCNPETRPPVEKLPCATRPCPWP